MEHVMAESNRVESGGKRPGNSLLSDSSYAGPLVVHGGNHRTSQIHELVGRGGFQLTYVDRQRATNHRSAYWSGTKFLGRYYRTLRPAPWMTWRQWRVNHVHYWKALTEHRGRKVLLWEVTIPPNWIAPHVANDAGFRVLAVPQNIESLVPGADPGHALEQELRHLRAASAVICISEEEQALLKSHGIQAGYLPYHPHTSLLRSLLQIRKDRAGVPTNQDVLLLGTAHNPPTRDGMLEIIQWARAGGLPGTVKLHLAGLGTESLRAELPDRGFALHGTVSDEHLQRLVRQSRCLLAHQRSGCGALTRIPEMLAAGLPVVASKVAARSTSHLRGVHVYNSPEELTALLACQLPVPPVPSPPTEAEEEFIRSLTGLAA